MLQRTRQLLLMADGAASVDAPSLRRWAIECHELSRPGRGRTLERWQVLEQLGFASLPLAKLVESHLDAVAILAEAGRHDLLDRLCAHTGEPAPVWQVWAAEAPGQPLELDMADLESTDYEGPVRLHGTKAWCSGGEWADVGLVTVWPTRGMSPDAAASARAAGPWLVAVPMRQDGLTVRPSRWSAAGMAGSMTCELSFDGAIGWPVGPQGWYLTRPGFWHGGAGVAATWLGGTRAVASALARRLCDPARTAHELALVALGRVDVAMQSAVALLRQTAADIDSRPQADARIPVQALRLAVDATARQVMDAVETTLGPGPMVGDAALAASLQDLRVFIRQCHADRDALSLAQARPLDTYTGRWMP